MVGIPTVALTAALAAAPVLAVDVTATKAISFFVFMGATGFLLGWLLGDEYRILPSIGKNAPRQAPSDLDRKAEVAVERLANGEAAPEIAEIIQATRSPNQVASVFPGQRVQRLVELLQEAPPSDQARRPRQEHLYTLLTHIATWAPEELRVPLACTLGRALPVHRSLIPNLLEVCKAHPALWNDLQSRFDEAGARDPSMARYLESHAGPDQAFVRRANDQFMNEMERFRRLCEDQGAGLGALASPELKEMIRHELVVLELSRGASRRFMWLASNARIVLKVLTPEQLAIIEGAVRQGVASACAFVSRAVLVWAHAGDQQTALRMIDALAEAANDHATAADALFGLIHGIRPTRNHPQLTPTQSVLRKRAFEHLQQLAQRSYEVRATLSTHGLLGAHYQDPGDDEVTLDSTAF